MEKKKGDGQAKNNYKDSAVEIRRIISVSKNKLPTSTKRGTMMTGQTFTAQKKVKSEKYYNEIGGEIRFRGEFGMTINF